MKIITWNVNGLRSILSKNKKGLRDTNDPNVLETLIKEHDPDFICLQETKCPNNLEVLLPFKFKLIIDSKKRKGYSGVAVFAKEEPLRILDDFPENEEGRMICLEYPKFYVINTYTPNSKQKLERLDYRINIWESLIIEYINRLNKPVIFCSDFNVAPNEIDIYDIRGHTRAAGYTIEERNAYERLLESCKLVNTFRYLYPNVRKYTWFSNFGKARENNKGWTIDHILVSKNLVKQIKDVEILSDYYSSDHIPVMLTI